MKILAEKPSPHGELYAPSWTVDRFPKTPRLRPGMKLRAQDGATFYLQETIEYQVIRNGVPAEVSYALGLSSTAVDGCRPPRVGDILEIV